MLIGTLFRMPPTGIPHRHVGTPPTWERVVTYLLKLLDFGNLRDGSQSITAPMLPNQIFRILPLCIEPTHRDARNVTGHTGMLDEFMGSQTKVAIYPCLCNLLQKVMIHACSDTRL